LFAATNLQLLRDTLDVPVTAASISRTPLASTVPVPTTRNKLGTALANMQGLCGTLSSEGVHFVRGLLLRERPSLIWLDSSILGRLIPLIRALLPQTRIVCAFQNVEADLIRQRLAAMQMHYLPALYATRINEGYSARESDLTLALHATDATRIARLYQRPVDELFPIIVPDRIAQRSDQVDSSHDGRPYVLFVGSGTPPNIEALEFMARHIAPAVRGFRLVAVGSGLEKVAPVLGHPNLQIQGFVEDLSALYRGASAVIAPIFSGGGMKVKIAEALMHGKLVIASPFAAIGYESCGEDAVRLARAPSEFASLIDGLSADSYSRAARSSYESNFSRGSGLQRVGAIVKALCPDAPLKPTSTVWP